MNIYEYKEQYSFFTQEARVDKFKLILDNLKKLVDSDPELIDYLIEDGLLDALIDIESNDGFGTEGTNI